MRRKAAEPATGTKTLVINLACGTEIRVDVPAESKVTFGPAIPGTMRNGGFGERALEYAVRVYAGATEKTGLRAVFTAVRQFREDTIPVRKLVIREAGKEIWKTDEEGFEMTRSVKKERVLLKDEFK